ncbi:MAG: GWxTD domain-containing protein [Candidatus Kapaibacterium sp.]
MSAMKPSSAIVLIASGALAGAPCHAQDLPDVASPRVLTDVIVLRGTTIAAPARCDVYVAVPYQLLTFTANSDRMLAEYSVSMTIRDSLGNRIVDTTYKRSITEQSYAVSRGTTGKSDNSLRRFDLRPGSYTLETVVSDAFGRRDHAGSRTFRIHEFNSASVELSSPMYVSQIEQRGNRYAITPFVGDIVWSHDVQLFVFLEAYLSGQPRSLRYRWNLTRSDGRQASSGESDIVRCERVATQSFFPLHLGHRLLPGTYSLRITAHPVSDDGLTDTSIVEARAERQYIVPRSMAADVVADLKKATRQLMYVADQDQIDAIMNAPSEGEALSLFEDFWRDLDPTPGTLKNEAFDEYYGRIDEANKRFKSYNEGWLTDMGRVFIIYGEPYTIDRGMSPNGMSRIVRWIYPNVTFTFEDTSGFGDFRLRSGLIGSGKYRYQRQ